MASYASLPHLYLVTPEPGDSPADFLRQLEASLRHGIRLVQFRAKTMAPASYRALAIDVLACCRQYDALLLLNADPRLLDEVNADGVHLDGARLEACGNRPPAFGSGKLVGAACHSLAQLRQAEAIAADLVTLSPVLPTASHPGAATLGWEKLAELTAQTALPVYALGGMHADLLAQAQRHGAYGVAGIQAFWGQKEKI
ncbi:thiamine phosphate synthase [Oxalobacteraceae bacterium CAVE-383]|nr:thiamine phosphate synthase [Oxalobacteraceae bacterium CAVE-383]